MKKNLCLLGALGVLLLGTLWVRPLANPDEGRYAEIPREMVETGDWIVPRLNGVIYFEKPPLAYWINALAIKFFGLSVGSVRFPNALMAWLTCCLVMVAGTALYGAKKAFWGTLVLGTSGLFFGMSQVMTVDMTLTACLTVVWVSFVMVMRGESCIGNFSFREKRKSFQTFQRKAISKGIFSAEKMPFEREFFGKGSGKTDFCKKWFSWRNLWLWGFYAGIALAVLAKGLVGILIPACVIFSWIFLFRQWNLLKKLFSLEGIVIFLAIVLPWHILAMQRQPAFAWFYFVHEHFLRYLTPIHSREQPVYFFILAFFLGSLPWVFFGGYVYKGWMKDHKRDPLEAFLAFWSVFIVAFFSISKSKLIPYILPAMPPAMLIIGVRVHDIWEGIENGRGVRWIFRFIGGLFTVGGAIAPYFLKQRTELDIAASSAIYSLLQWSFLLGGVGLLYGAFKKHYRVCLGVLVMTMVSFMLCMNGVAKFVQRQGTLECAEEIKKHFKEGESVFAFYDYFQDLPFYLRRTIGLVNIVPSEQAFGARLEFPKDRYIRMEQLKALCEKKRIYGVVKSNHFEKMLGELEDIPVHILTHNKDFVLWSNQESK